MSRIDVSSKLTRLLLLRDDGRRAPATCARRRIVGERGLAGDRVEPMVEEGSGLAGAVEPRVGTVRLSLLLIELTRLAGLESRLGTLGTGLSGEGVTIVGVACIARGGTDGDGVRAGGRMLGLGVASFAAAVGCGLLLGVLASSIISYTGRSVSNTVIFTLVSSRHGSSPAVSLLCR